MTTKIREYSNELPVIININEYKEYIQATMVSGDHLGSMRYGSVRIDLRDVIKWVLENKPELIDEVKSVEKIDKDNNTIKRLHTKNCGKCMECKYARLIHDEKYLGDFTVGCGLPTTRIIIDDDGKIIRSAQIYRDCQTIKEETKDKCFELIRQPDKITERTYVFTEKSLFYNNGRIQYED